MISTRSALSLNPELHADLSPNRSNRRHIDRMFAHHRAPELPADFE